MSIILRPRDEPTVWNTSIKAYILMINALIPACPYNLEWQYNNNKVLLNAVLGKTVGTNLGGSNCYERSGIWLWLEPQTNLANNQYLIIFKAENSTTPESRKFQIYQNGILAGTQTMSPTDNQFAILADCDGSNDTYIFFNLANWSYPLFKEIEIDII